MAGPGDIPESITATVTPAPVMPCDQTERAPIWSTTWYIEPGGRVDGSIEASTPDASPRTETLLFVAITRPPEMSATAASTAQP
jgi:hypothetical protein